MTEFKIHLASKQHVKVAAVYEIVKDHLKTPVTITIVPNDCKSGVSEQPFGLDEIELGANNRLKSIQSLPAVSLETGLVQYGEEPDSLADITCCVLRTNLGTFTGWSSPYQCPTEYVKEWLTLPNKSDVTLGSIAAVRYVPDCYNHHRSNDPSNWYNREDYLAEAFTDTLFQYSRALMSMPKLTVDVVPYKGVPFVDIQANLQKEPQKVTEALSKLLERVLFNVVVVADARGFLMVAPFMKPGIKIVLARKPNKLPKEVASIEYKKEYETDTICIEKNSILPGDRVVILDDVLATGGTADAIGKLVEQEQGIVVCYAFLFAIAIEKSAADSTTDIKLMNTVLPLDKVRFVTTQLTDVTKLDLFKEVTRAQHVEHLYVENTVCIIPPSLNSFIPMHKVVEVKWDKYSTCSNIQFDASALAGKHVIVYVNLLDQREALDVLALVSILHRKDVDRKDITIVVPYMDPATQDRIEYRGKLETLALIDTTAKLFDGYKVITYDLHALQSQFAFYDLRNHSIVRHIWDRFIMFNPDVVPVFPDEGSMKRFGTLLGIENSVTFRKKRDGAKRIMATDDTIIPGTRYVIIDDLVRSGGTMASAAKYLLSKGAASVDAIFAHGPFEPDTGKNLSIFRRIWTSNSCPAHVPREWVQYKF